MSPTLRPPEEVRLKRTGDEYKGTSTSRGSGASEGADAEVGRRSEDVGAELSAGEEVVAAISRRRSNDWVVQYRGHFLQLKPQNKRYGPTQAKALICEWEDGAVEVRYRGKRMDYEDLAVRPPVVQAAAGEASRELAKQVGSKPAQDHPWRQGYERRRKAQRLQPSPVSSLLGVS